MNITVDSHANVRLLYELTKFYLLLIEFEKRLWVYFFIISHDFWVHKISFSMIFWAGIFAVL